jgi:phage terminase large subunit-like protein
VTLDAEREAMGDYVFETQYNQTCEETSSGILQLQWFRFFRFDGTQVPNNRPTGSSDVPTLVLSPDHRGRFFDAIYFSIDAAFKKAESQNAKKGATRSEVGFLIVAKRGANIFIVEDLTVGMSYTEMIDLIKTKSLEYSPTAIYIEDKANGSAAEEELRSEFNNVVLLEPNGGKEPTLAMVDMAGSAALNTVVAANEVWAKHHAAEIGGIGTYVMFSKKMLEQMSTDLAFIYSEGSEGKNAAMRALLAGDTSLIQQEVNKSAEQFRENVRTSRELRGDVEKTLSGAMFDAKEARRRGLIDGIGNFNEIMGRVQTLVRRRKMK